MIGAYANLPADLLRPFVCSLRATGYRGRVVVVTGPCQAAERDGVLRLVDGAIEADADYSDSGDRAAFVLSWLRRTRGLRRLYPTAFRLAVRASTPAARRALEYRLEGLQALRYAHYASAIRECSPTPDFVMISDLRDVVFQRDPFGDPVRGLELYLEDPTVRIGADDFNTRWIRNLYGPNRLAQMSGRFVSCCGTVVGTRDAMLSYVDRMADELSRHDIPLGPHDQGAHNNLLFEGKLPPHELVENGHGRVLTMGRMASYETDDEGRVLNQDGSVPAVVHQWDRHPELAQRIAAHWEESA